MTYDEACRAIAETLQAFEKESGEVVDRIIFRDIDVSNIDKKGKRVVRSVEIETYPVPGVQWGDISSDFPKR